MKEYLKTGEPVRDGDFLVYGENLKVEVKKCRYDPGCCVGHIVEPHEIYYREKRDDPIYGLGKKAEYS